MNYSREILVDKLIQQLKERDAAKQESATRVLEALGPGTAPQLVAHLLDSKDTAFRLRLVDVMTAIGPASPDVVPACIRLLFTEPAGPLREAALEAVGKLGAASGHTENEKAGLGQSKST